MRDFKLSNSSMLKIAYPKEFIAKHGKKTAIAAAVALIGLATFMFAEPLLFEDEPIVSSHVVEAPPVPATESTEVSDDSKAADGIMYDKDGNVVARVYNGEESPSQPGVSTELKGSGVKQAVSLTKGVEAGNQEAKLIADLSSQVTDLTAKVAAQDERFAKLEESIKKLSAPQPKPRKTSDVSDAGNTFNVQKLNLIGIGPARAIIKTKDGQLIVKPGEAFPGGVVFISYDQSTHVLKTTAGEYLVQQ